MKSCSCYWKNYHFCIINEHRWLFRRSDSNNELKIPPISACCFQQCQRRAVCGAEWNGNYHSGNLSHILFRNSFLNEASSCFVTAALFVTLFQTVDYGKWRNFPAELSLYIEYEQLQIWGELFISLLHILLTTRAPYGEHNEANILLMLFVSDYLGERNCDINGWMVRLTLSTEWCDELLSDTCSDKRSKRQDNADEYTSDGGWQGDV